jgi:hypothetical protein
MKEPWKPINRVLLVLQFWEGDKARAGQVARLLSDIEPRHTEQADLLFASRFDCEADPHAVLYAARKFNVATFKGRRRGVGWPNGCNDLWFDVMTHLYELQSCDKLPHYKAVLTFEPDCVPLALDWLPRLSAAWDEAAKAGCHALGAELPHPARHINGNALFSASPQFLYWVARKVRGCSATQGWDYAIRDQIFKWGGKDTPLIRSFWALRTCEPGVVPGLVSQGCVFFHGCKDESALREARGILLTQAQNCAV